MSLYLCDSRHSQIAYNEEEKCPLCCALKELSIKEKRVKTLEEDENNLLDKIYDLEKTIKELEASHVTP